MIKTNVLLSTGTNFRQSWAMRCVVCGRVHLLPARTRIYCLLFFLQPVTNLWVGALLLCTHTSFHGCFGALYVLREGCAQLTYLVCTGLPCCMLCTVRMVCADCHGMQWRCLRHTLTRLKVYTLSAPCTFRVCVCMCVCVCLPILLPVYLSLGVCILCLWLAVSAFFI